MSDKNKTMYVMTVTYNDIVSKHVEIFGGKDLNVLSKKFTSYYFNKNHELFGCLEDLVDFLDFINPECGDSFGEVKYEVVQLSKLRVQVIQV